MYESSLIEPQAVGEFLETLNGENYELVNTVYLSDSNQVLFIVKKPKVVKPILKAKEEPEEEE